MAVCDGSCSSIGYFIISYLGLPNDYAKKLRTNSSPTSRCTKRPRCYAPHKTDCSCRVRCFTYYWAKCHDMGSSHPANEALGPTCRLEWES